MQYTFYTIGNLLILVAMIIMALRYKTMDRTYLPFFYLILLGSLNEMVTLVTARVFHTSAVNNNIYVLMEGLIILWQFKKWDLFEDNNKLYNLLFATFIAVWVWEIFIHSKITYVASYYRIVYATFTSIASIHMINRLVITENRSLLQSAAFLICSAFIFYYPIKVLIEIFYLYGYKLYPDLRRNIYHIHFFVNLLTNLFFAVAASWVPRKRTYFIPS